MLLPSEIEAKSLIPAVRAILARSLLENIPSRKKMLQGSWHYKAAVSNYVRGTRGDVDLISKLESVREVMRMIDDIAKDLSTNKLTPQAHLPSSWVCATICGIHSLYVTFTTALSQTLMSRFANSAEVLWFVNTSLRNFLSK